MKPRSLWVRYGLSGGSAIGAEEMPGDLIQLLFRSGAIFSARGCPAI